MILLIIFINIYSSYANDGINSPSHRESEEIAEPKSNGLTDYLQNSTMPLLPGDGLWISTFPDTSSFLNQTFPIDDRGYIDFPLIGKVQVSSMTEKQIVSFIKNNFKNYIRSPNIAIKPMLRLSMIGGFIRPGMYYVDYDNSFWNTLQLSGDPILEDGIKDMQWERNGESMMDDLIPFFERGVSLRTMGFKSGDIIWTPSPGPGVENVWDDVLRYGLPFLTLATTMTMLWLTYQQTVIIYTAR